MGNIMALKFLLEEISGLSGVINITPPGFLPLGCPMKNLHNKKKLKPINDFCGFLN